jgi:hypothetical protein
MENFSDAGNNVMKATLGDVNDTYKGLHQWFNEDLAGNLWSSIGPLAAKESERPQTAANNVLTGSLGDVNDTYKGLHRWFDEDVVGNLWSNIGQLVGKALKENPTLVQNPHQTDVLFNPPYPHE